MFAQISNGEVRSGEEPRIIVRTLFPLSQGWGGGELGKADNCACSFKKSAALVFIFQKFVNSGFFFARGSPLDVSTAGSMQSQLVCLSALLTFSGRKGGVAGPPRPFLE